MILLGDREYVRRSRRRQWFQRLRPDFSSATETLSTCVSTVSLRIEQKSIGDAYPVCRNACSPASLTLLGSDGKMPAIFAGYYASTPATSLSRGRLDPFSDREEGMVHDRRKADHIRINLEEDVQFPNLTNGFERYRLVHQALPELDLGQIDASVELICKRLDLPFSFPP
jgi:hypothetical protein